METKNAVIIMSDAYIGQTFHRGLYRVDLRDVPGTGGYCDDAARAVIRERLSALPLDAVHFIDGGNYHYLSLFFAERVREPFALALYDHHSDMQPSAFGGLLSCGSWALDLLEGESFCRQIALIGAGDDQVVPDAVSDRVTRVSAESAPDAFRSLPADLPVYISVDKDVLSPSAAITDWDQGTMTERALTESLKAIGMNRRIIGMDICGEGEDSRHDALNARLLALGQAILNDPKS